MKYIARWAGLVGLAAAVAFMVNQGLSLIPPQDHDGRTAAVIVGILVVGLLGGVGLFFELDD